MKTLNYSLLTAALLLVAGNAQAFGVGVRAGTTGLGADIGFSLAPTVLARIGYGGGNFSTDVTANNVSYDAKFKSSTGSLLIDWSPLGPFRVTAGFMPNNNRIDLTGNPQNGSYSFNGNTYQASDVASLSGSVKAGNRFAPYVGIGYGNVATAGVNFYADLGVMYMGSPKTTLSAACGATASPAECNQLQADVAVEQGRLGDDLRFARWYPIANIGVTVGF
ncbi:autotransporter outer membrane beta-barrel domain-containing protein [Niveibacterium sp. SC-1]|uniref:autotransporter outer membrane beta-barrel domain-containing protein n=1 Tax=Niveibacterium sp. SC-1 TaxID=3135646 RepID=UPI00311F9233